MSRKGRGNLDTYFVSSNGAEIRLRPVAQLAIQMLRQKARADVLAEGFILEPPTYTVTTGLGEKETYPHDATTLATDEDRAAWERYQAGILRLEMLQNERATMLLFRKGIDLPPMSKETEVEWREMGVEFAEDATERYIQYIQLEYLPTPDDVQQAMKAIMLLSNQGAPQGVLEAIEATFRRNVEGNASEATGDAPEQVEV